MSLKSVVINGRVSIAVTDFGGGGTAVVLLHGLAGSSREMTATAMALSSKYRVLLIDQRGHGLSSHYPEDVSREAFVSDVVKILESYAPGKRCILIGQSMGAHTAFLTAVERPDLVEKLIMLEGHVAGDENPESAKAIGDYFASWPAQFDDESAAREFLGHSALASAWIADLEQRETGLHVRFDPEIMRETIRAVHVPRWSEWEKLETTTIAIFAKESMFSVAEQKELIRRRPQTKMIKLDAGSHDAHLDAFDQWNDALKLALVF